MHLVGFDVLAAVVFPHDDFLRRINQPAGRVAAGRCPQRCIGKSAPRPVGANEVLPGGEALPEAGLHRREESLDFAARGGESHQAAHARHLLDLGDVPLGAGVGHSGHAAIVGKIVAHLRFHAFRSHRPDLGDAILLFCFVHHSLHIVFLEISHLVGGFGEDFRLVRRHL